MYTMLTQYQAEKLALEYQTTVDNVLKEHYQIFLLDLIYKSSLEDRMIFKGGTALRLAYNSFRFSEDLDFSLMSQVSFDEFSTVIKHFVQIFPEAEIKDLSKKYSTLFARIVFKVEYKPIPLGIKVEVNKQSANFEQVVALLKSPFNNLEVLGRVYSLESIFKDKTRIIQNNLRRQPRDLFDAWYISQKLSMNWPIKPEYKYTKKELMDGLNYLLPTNKAKVMELFSNEKPTIN